MPDPPSPPNASMAPPTPNSAPSPRRGSHYLSPNALAHLALSADPNDGLDTDPDRLALLLADAQAANKSLVDENEYLHRKQAHQATELTTLHSTVARLEQAVFKHQSELETTQRDLANALAANRVLERKLEGESEALDEQRLTWVQREEELSELRKSIRVSALSVLGVGGAAGASAGGSGTATPLEGIPEEEDAVEAEAVMGQPRRPTPEAAARDIKAATKVLRAQEQLIGDLRADLDTLQSSLSSAHKDNDGLKDRVVDLSNELIQMEEINKALMEENEAFQMLLSERTVAGEFFLPRPPQPLGAWKPATGGSGGGGAGAGAGTAAVSVPTSPVATNAHLVGMSASMPTTPVGATSLADEISGPVSHAEVRSLQSENRALTLYIQKILGRIMEYPELQGLLASDYSGERLVAKAAGADRASRSAGSSPGKSSTTSRNSSPPNDAAASSSPPATTSGSPLTSRRISWIPRRVSMFAGNLGLTTAAAARDRSSSPNNYPTSSTSADSPPTSSVKSAASSQTRDDHILDTYYTDSYDDGLGPDGFPKGSLASQLGGGGSMGHFGRPGETLVVVDALSPIPPPAPPAAQSLSVPSSPRKERGRMSWIR